MTCNPQRFDLCYLHGMILCPVCLHVLPRGLQQCPFCSAELDDETLEEQDEQIAWKIVRTVSTEVEATLIAGRLRAYGVPAFVLSQVDSTRHFTVGALAVAKVFVPETMKDEAERILAMPVEEGFDEEGYQEGDDAEEDSGRDNNHSTDRFNG
jgi:hypothetical protein